MTPDAARPYPGYGLTDIPLGGACRAISKGLVVHNQCEVLRPIKLMGLVPVIRKRIIVRIVRKVSLGHEVQN